MARLNVQAAAQWQGAAPDHPVGGQQTFERIPMLLALSLTNEDGAVVDGLQASEIRVGFQINPQGTEGAIAEISDFHHNGPTSGTGFGAGWYSCIVKPPADGGWIRHEVFLCVTVRRGQDRGQALLLARYRVFAFA